METKLTEAEQKWLEVRFKMVERIETPQDSWVVHSHFEVFKNVAEVCCRTEYCFYTSSDWDPKRPKIIYWGYDPYAHVWHCYQPEDQ